MSDRALSILVHGAARAGKTTFSATAPYPRLILDVEKGSRFLKVNKKRWDPMTEPPPQADGTWDTCVVRVDDFDTAIKAYEWLKSGQHQFRSVTLDSISELQAKCQEQIVGRGKMQTQDWGTLLQRMAFFCRDLRDLTEHSTTPIEAVIIIAMSRDKDGIIRPFLQGQIENQIPYWFDITGYLYVDQVADEAGTIHEVRRLLVGKNPNYESGSRVPGLPTVIDYPNVEQIIDSTFGPRPEVPSAPVS